MESWISTAIAQWEAFSVEMNPPATIEEIALAEAVLGFEFPEDFKKLYLAVNGFVLWDMQEELFTLWPLSEITNDFQIGKDKDFIGICDYLVYSHALGFSKKFEGLFKDYEHVKDCAIAKTFKELIEIINSNPSIAY